MHTTSHTGSRRWQQLAVACAMAAPLLATAAPAGLQDRSNIYSCTDGRGYRITSDRPIAECSDREQRILGPSGVERGRLAPAQSENDKLRAAEQQRLRKLEAQRIQDQERLDRQLLLRYPDQAAHDAERRQHMVQFDDALALAQTQLEQLRSTRDQLLRELQPYQNEPASAPATLRRAAEQSLEAIATQERVLASTTAARQRASARLDEELQRLKTLWANPPKP